MAPPLSQSARDRLRAQVRREQDLAARVVNAETRLAAEIVKRDAAITDRDRALARRRDELADALTDYIEQAGVSVERAAVVLDRPKADIAPDRPRTPNPPQKQ